MTLQEIRDQIERWQNVIDSYDGSDGVWAKMAVQNAEQELEELEYMEAKVQGL